MLKIIVIQSCIRHHFEALQSFFEEHLRWRSNEIQFSEPIARKIHDDVIHMYTDESLQQCFQ